MTDIETEDGILFDKIGGWLVFPAFIHPVFAILGNIRGVYDVLQPYSDAMPFEAKAFLIFVGVLGVASAIAWLISGYLAGTLHPSFPVYYISLNILGALVSLIILLITVYHFKVPATSEDRTDILKDLMGLAIWVPYMLVSKRVKATFYGIPMHLTPRDRNIISPLKQVVDERKALRAYSAQATSMPELTMVQRLGNVLYWGGCILAVFFVFGGIIVAVIMSSGSNPSDLKAAPIVGLSIAACAIFPWGIGRACRYVLTGH